MNDEKVEISVDIKVKVCKHWQKNGICIYTNKCKFLHPADITFIGNKKPQQRGIRKRKRIYNEGRVSALRRWLIDVFGIQYLNQGSGVIDVAGGKGEFAFELLNLNGIKSTVFDPRPLELRRFKRKLLFGYYHKNDILGKYNTIPHGMALQLPSHIRGFFQHSNSKELNTAKLDSSDIILSLPKMLHSEETFLIELNFSRRTSWTVKGLCHENDDSDDNISNDGDISNNQYLDGDNNDECNCDMMTITTIVATTSNMIDDKLLCHPCNSIVLESILPDSIPSITTNIIDISSTNSNDIPHMFTSNSTPTTTTTTTNENTLKSGNYNNTEIDMAYETNEGLEITDYDTACQIMANCSLIVGMHPDQAAEHIIDYCLAVQKPFAVVPCCVYSKQFPTRRMSGGDPVRVYGDFIEFLLRKSEDIHSLVLDFDGKNVLLYYLAGWSPLQDPETVTPHISKGKASSKDWWALSVIGTKKQNKNQTNVNKNLENGTKTIKDIICIDDSSSTSSDYKGDRSKSIDNNNNNINNNNNNNNNNVKNSKKNQTKSGSPTTTTGSLVSSHAKEDYFNNLLESLFDEIVL